MNVIEAIGTALDSIGARYALIGARALGVRGYPRMTLDYDFLTDEARVLQDVVALVQLDRDRLIREVDGRVAAVHPEVSTAWQQLKASLS
ncbi:MAG TPA: hypothetical protein VFO89_09905 [Thermoanaerobaculia bacterium]|nr:hypothetical protein [Thermoanaerobaculia bacterium]